MRKNTRLLAGKPLIAHTIDAARACIAIDRIVVSTDDPEIGAIAQRHGAQVLWRPDELSNDTSSSESALLNTLEQLDASGYHPDLIAFLQCTAPLLTAADITAVIHALIDQNADSALAAVPFHYFLWKQDVAKNALGINHDPSIRPMRQEREAQYLETGSIYVMRAAGFRKARHRFFGKTILHVLPSEHALEIDEPLDFEIAEMRLRRHAEEQRAKIIPNPVRALVLDFDGVFTDNTVLVREDGNESVLCNRSDGLGLEHLRKTGISILVLSSETNPVVRARADKLKLTSLQITGDKWATLEPWLKERGILPEHTIYIGNDINDVSCLQAVGCGLAVADARPEAKTAARAVLAASGGKGAIREVVDMIMKSDPSNPILP